MGADNLRDFHRWQNWRKIAMTFPIAVIDRPGATLAFLSSVMAKTFDYARVDEHDAGTLGFLRPRWTFIHGPRSRLSSTAIRSAGAIGRPDLPKLRASGVQPSHRPRHRRDYDGRTQHRRAGL